MNVREICWRVSQKLLQRKEAKAYGNRRVAVTERVFDSSLAGLSFHTDAIGLNFQNNHTNARTDIHLLGGYGYATYEWLWNAGFQTGQSWGDECSYDLSYKQRDEIGDARTNWELNRHFQFALMGKAFYVTRDEKYAERLESQFTDWNEHAPFLRGISWTSVMEVAIRSIQWIVALAFLKKGSDQRAELHDRMERGILNMASYVAQHYSRYSSANNHLIVEATALAFAGYAFDYKPWQRLAKRILDEELSRQNCADGVNKEMSLHYQTFGMEAYALVMHLMKKHGEEVPMAWIEMMKRQCDFVAHSMVDEGTACEFGDNDEGKILDLVGGHVCHYRYVLQLCSIVTGQRFDDLQRPVETIGWLFTDEEIAQCGALPLFQLSAMRTFTEGGYTFLRSEDGRMVVGIDHAPLGFGSIAAHGHADALSFQVYVDGKCFLGDPGTFIYHCNIEKRNDYRRTSNHNTVWTEGEEQSQMMGAFLWGRRAQTKLRNYSYDKETGECHLEAECKWWNGYEHKREFTYKGKEGELIVVDSFGVEKANATLMVHPACIVKTDGNTATLMRDEVTLRIESDGQLQVEKSWYSEAYGVEKASKKIIISYENKLTTRIWIGKS